MPRQQELLFDALRGEGQPTQLFGPLLIGPASQEAIDSLLETATIAARRIESTFGARVTSSEQGVRQLDGLLTDMWATGWSPDSCNFDLFATDFGALFASAIYGLDSLQPVFRSSNSLDHMSFWCESLNIEFFPFHKVAKALLHREGENLQQMYSAIVNPTLA